MDSPVFRALAEALAEEAAEKKEVSSVREAAQKIRDRALDESKQAIQGRLEGEIHYTWIPPCGETTLISVADGNPFDILIDDEEGYALHPSGKLRFQFTWDLDQHNETNTLIYIIYCENPITRREFKRVQFSHGISSRLPKNFHIGLHSVTFSPDWRHGHRDHRVRARPAQGRPGPRQDHDPRVPVANRRFPEPWR
jgi:hypothetical protein